MAFFPAFIDIENKDCLVIGGGGIAYRKIRTLLDFGAHVIVVSQEVIPEILAMDNIDIALRSVSLEDCDDKQLVIAATNDSVVNHTISVYCKSKNILVNVVDCKKECSFILPSYVKEKNLVAAFSSAGNSPALTQYLKERERTILTPFMGELNEFLGEYRTTILERFETEEQRKRAFTYIIDYALMKREIPNQNRIEELLHEI